MNYPHLNRVILIGNLGQDPEILFLPKGGTMVRCSLVTNKVWTDRQGEKQTTAQWHRLIGWGAVPDMCNNLKKGQTVHVEGEIEYTQYTDEAGHKKTGTQINIQTIRLLRKIG